MRERPPPKPPSPLESAHRDGLLLFVLGMLLGGLAVGAAIARLDLGSRLFPLWAPLALNAGIVTVTGALIGGGFLEYARPVEGSEEFVQVRRSEWERARAALSARPRATASGRVPVSAPARSPSPAPVVAGRPRPSPGPAPATRTSTPVAAAPHPVALPSSSLAFLPLAQKGTRPRPPRSSRPPADRPAPLTPPELDAMERLGAALGIRRVESESEDQFAARLLAVADQGRNTTDTGGEPVPPRPARRPRDPDWKESESEEGPIEGRSRELEGIEPEESDAGSPGTYDRE